MPKIVDHHERRVGIARAVEDIVFEAGIDAVTIRDVASRIGLSTSVVSHYFRTKQEMVVFTHQLVRSRAEAELAAAIAAGEPFEACLERLLPTDEARWRDWHIWFAFWGMAAAEPDINREWSSSVNDARALFGGLVERTRAQGRLDPALDLDTVVSEIQVTINGIASLAAQDRAAWPAERQRTLLRRMLGRSFGP